MANPGQAIPPGHESNPDQDMDIGMIPRDREAYNDEADGQHHARDRGATGDGERDGTRGAGGVTEGRARALDSDVADMLEHGGYGGEQEYADSATDDRSWPQADEESRQEGQWRIDGTGITTDTRQSGL